MNDKRITSEQIDELIDSVSEMEQVNTPPFFKDKVLKKLGNIEEPVEDSVLINWFTPKLQIAALLAFVFLNLGVLFYYNTSNKQEELETFAQTYGLSASEDESILN